MGCSITKKLIDILIFKGYLRYEINGNKNQVNKLGFTSIILAGNSYEKG